MAYRDQNKKLRQFSQTILRDEAQNWAIFFKLGGVAVLVILGCMAIPDLSKAGQALQENAQAQEDQWEAFYTAPKPQQAKPTPTPSGW